MAPLRDNAASQKVYEEHCELIREVVDLKRGIDGANV